MSLQWSNDQMLFPHLMLFLYLGDELSDGNNTIISIMCDYFVRIAGCLLFIFMHEGVKSVKAFSLLFYIPSTNIFGATARIL